VDHDGLRLRLMQPAIVPPELSPILGFCFGPSGSLILSHMRHDLIDRRSLELNRLVAEKIRQQPELMDLVREKLDLTLGESRLSESCKDALREW